TKHIPKNWVFDDEFYMIRNFDRSKMRVLLRFDVSKLPAIHAFRRPDNELPVAWAKSYGKGRVFYSSFSHGIQGWDNIYVQQMYREGLKGATGQGEIDASPRPMQGPQAPPKTPPVPRATGLGNRGVVSIPAGCELMETNGQRFCYGGRQ